MPSSISSSNDRLPNTKPILVWGTALCVVLILAGGLELFWRSQGYLPTVVDDDDLWSYERGHIDSAKDNSIALVGVSRLHQGFIPETFHETFPDTTVYQLSRFNSNPVLLLKDIAEETEYAGLVICSLMAQHLIPDQWSSPSLLIEYYHHGWTLNKRLNRAARTVFESRLVLMHPDLKLQYALPDIVRGNWPIAWIDTYADRTQRVDYTKPDLVAFTKSRLATHTRQANESIEREGYKNWPQPELLAQIEGWVETIKARGGQVVFVRAVSSGGHWVVDRTHFPREKFWDVFAASTTAETIHFKDIEALASLECAEGSHLYYEDAIIFTRVLTNELKTRGLLTTN